jgi:microcystin degradation protein MlrC
MSAKRTAEVALHIASQTADAAHGASAASKPRIAVCGFFIECNRWSPVSTAGSFADVFDQSGEALLEQMRLPQSHALPTLTAFTAEMDRSGPWEPVPLRVAAAQPGGPVEHAFFEQLLAQISDGLRAAGSVDGVFIAAHGAALTTQHDNPDGVLFERIRQIVGPGVPVVAVFDLHTNVTPMMADALSAFVAYQTNPHVDQRPRGADCARHLRTLLTEGPGVVELVKLPLVPPATTQLVAPGMPYHDLIQIGQQRVGANILDVSLCGGFALADSPTCGFAVVVSASQGDRAAAHRVANELAAQVWAARERFELQLMSQDDAVSAAVQAGLQKEGPGLILADVADNPGGGGGGNTTWLLAALHQAGAQGVLLAVHTDAALAAQAYQAGVGAEFVARFNRSARDDRYARPFEAPARVLALSDGRFVGRRGLAAGSTREMGPSALLQIDGLRVAVISLRQQLLDPAQLDILGVDLADVRTLVVKSRGHFRAAFDTFAPPSRIFEVDCPGLTTPKLKTLPWTRMRRPVYPIDDSVHWSP